MTEKVTLSLKSLLAPSKAVEADFPGYDGFKVNLSYLSRETLQNIRKKATKQTMKGRNITEDLDEELFLKLYSDAAIKGWSGLKLSYLDQLAPVDVSTEDAEAELAYSADNAYFLMRNSGTFDSWISDKVVELGNFPSLSAKK